MTSEEKKTDGEEKPGMSRVRLAIGAASLFLFIVGLKRSYRVDAQSGAGEERRPRGEIHTP